MKKIVFVAAMLMVCIAGFAQTTTTSAAATAEEKYAGYMCNSPLPYRPARLNILFIGNSFSIDTSAGAREILNNMSIKNVNIYVLYKGSCSLKEHYELFRSNDKAYQLWRYNYEKGEMMEKKISIREAMKMFDYDIVVFQQYSLESGEFVSYEPYLSKLVAAYKMVSIAPRTTFAWNMTWAYSSKHKNIGRYGSQEKMYRAICSATRRMKAESGIDVIIPCGTAVQNARQMKGIVTKNELTRDNQHMDYCMGRYLAGCTFFESVIAPCLECNLRDDATILGKETETDHVNGSNRELLKKCARLAVGNNYSVSEWVNEN